MSKRAVYILMTVTLMALLYPLISLAQSTEPIVVRSLDWSPDGTQLALFGDGVWIYDQDLSVGRRLDTAASGAIAWSPDGTKIAVGNEIWDARTLQRITTIDTEVSLGGLAKSWSNDSTRIVNVGYEGRDIAIFDANTGNLLKVIEGDMLNINGIDWSPDDRQFVISLIDTTNAIALINIEEEKITARYSTAMFPGNIIWNPDGKRVAVMGSREVESGTPGSVETAGAAVLFSVQIWDMTSGTILHTFDGLPASTGRLRWRPDGEELVGGTANGSIFVWNIQTRALSSIFLSAGRLYDIDYSPLGGRLAIASNPARLANINPARRISTITEKQVVKALSNNAVEIAIPSPSLETLELLGRQCFGEERTVPDTIADVPTFITRLPELSADLQSASCEEELALVSNAIVAEQ